MTTAAKAGLAFAVMLFAWRMEAGVGVEATNAGAAATIRKVNVLGAGSTLEIEVVASRPIQPETQIITGPDRLVLDFFNAVPDSKLRDVNIERGELKRVRVGRFAANPPVTRVVLDLKSAQQFQLFPAGKTVIVKLAAPSGNQPQPGISAVSMPAPAPVAPPRKVEVNFANGKLRIWANKASLAEVLAEVHHRTGAEMSMPPGAGQDAIVTDLGPGPPREVLAALLNGSPFNFVITCSNSDPSQVRGIFLTMRQGGGGDSGITYPAVAVGQEPQQEPDQAMAPPDVEPAPEAAPAEPEMVPNQPQPEETPPPQQ